MAAVDLPLPRVGAAQDLAPTPVKVVLNWGRRYSLWVFNFGLACCAIEFIAASMARHDFIRLGVIPFAPAPRQADLMVVSGTVTDKMAPAVRRLYDQMPEPRYVISVSPKTHIRPDGTLPVCPASARPGDVTSASSVMRSRATPGLSSSSSRTSPLA